MAQQFQVDRTAALYERPVMEIVDAPAFGRVKQAIQDAFSAANVTRFLKTLEKQGVRIRNFEAVLQTGALGEAAAAGYAQLTHGDQGQIREFYLASLEQVELPLRDRFFKLYAYY